MEFEFEESLIDKRCIPYHNIETLIFSLDNTNVDDVYNKILPFKEEYGEFIETCLGFFDKIHLKIRKASTELANKLGIRERGSGFDRFDRLPPQCIIDDDIDKFIEESAICDFKEKVYSLEMINYERMTAIDAAAAFGSVKIFKYLSVNGYEMSETTAKLASQNGNEEIIQIIFNNNISFENCLDYAICGHSTKIAEWIISKYGIKNVCLSTIVKCFNTLAFFNIFLKGDYKNVDETEKYDVSAFSHAIYNFNYGLSEFLLEKGANIDFFGDGEEWTPLLNLADRSLKATEFLIKHGANVNHKNYNGATALLFAVTRRLDIAKVLIAAGADVNALDKDDYSMLHHAAG